MVLININVNNNNSTHQHTAELQSTIHHDIQKHLNIISHNTAKNIN
jgi:aminoglycoside N3'-acetyltransferase